MRKSDLVYLRHIMDGIDRLGDYLANATLGAFQKSPLLQAAAARELAIIGEAANKVSDDLKRAHGEVAWSRMGATRNRLIHAYFDVDVTLVWFTVRGDLPLLPGQIAAIIERSSGQAGLPANGPDHRP